MIQVQQEKQMIQHNSTPHMIVVLTVIESNNSLIYPSIIISLSNFVLNSPDKIFTKDHYPLIWKDIQMLHYNYSLISSYYMFIMLVINKQLYFTNNLLCPMLFCSPPGRYFNFRIIYLEKGNYIYPLKMYVLTVSKVSAKILEINSDLVNASQKDITNLNKFLYLYVNNG